MKFVRSAWATLWMVPGILCLFGFAFTLIMAIGPSKAADYLDKLSGR